MIEDQEEKTAGKQEGISLAFPAKNLLVNPSRLTEQVL